MMNMTRSGVRNRVPADQRMSADRTADHLRRARRPNVGAAGEIAFVVTAEIVGQRLRRHRVALRGVQGLRPSGAGLARPRSGHGGGGPASRLTRRWWGRRRRRGRGDRGRRPQRDRDTRRHFNTRLDRPSRPAAAPARSVWAAAAEAAAAGTPAYPPISAGLGNDSTSVPFERAVHGRLPDVRRQARAVHRATPRIHQRLGALSGAHPDRGRQRRGETDHPGVPVGAGVAELVGAGLGRRRAAAGQVVALGPAGDRLHGRGDVVGDGFIDALFAVGS